jgi:hypothetical protein
MCTAAECLSMWGEVLIGSPARAAAALNARLMLSTGLPPYSLDHIIRYSRLARLAQSFPPWMPHVPVSYFSNRGMGLGACRTSRDKSTRRAGRERLLRTCRAEAPCYHAYPLVTNGEAPTTAKGRPSPDRR